MKRINYYVCLVILAVAVLLGACGSQKTDDSSKVDWNQNSDISQKVDNVTASTAAPVCWQDLEWTRAMDLLYANQFSLEESGDYGLITIVDSGRFLLVNEEDFVPEQMPEDVVVIRRPLEKVYLQASSAFDPIVKIGALESIKLSGIKQEDLYIEEASLAMEQNRILYAGKYSAPDYELILTQGTTLAIESTMIYHNPEVKEKLEELGIPVMVERSSYETNPLGRLEWIKLWGFLFDKKTEAADYFARQTEQIDQISKMEKTDKTIAFFHVNSNGAINVRKPSDYIVKLIEMAGGNYALGQLKTDEENSLSTINIQMEDFYLYAKDADFLIYNSTIVGEIDSIDELIDKNPLFADFSAVKAGQVYCTERNFFQETTGMGKLLEDINGLLMEKEDDNFTYLRKLD